MGRCGRHASGEHENTFNSHHVFFALKEFVHLNERSFYEDKCDDYGNESTVALSENQNDAIIYVEEHRTLVQRNLIKCARLMTLSLGCWYRLLENECGHAYLSQASIGNNSNDDESIDCNGNCPRCDGSMEDAMQLVLRNGLIMFLVEAFGDKYNGKVTPLELSKQLCNFVNVGQIVYDRPNSQKSKSLQITELTIFQLIAANIIRIEIDATKTKPIVHLKIIL